MMRRIAPIAASLLVACSTGLSPFLVDDTGIDVGGPDDTGIGDPIDTADTDVDTDTDPNEAPVADAGDDTAGLVGDVILLDGTGSFDPDGDTLSWLWEMVEQPATSGSTLINEDQPQPRFYADRDGLYRVRLTVDDGLLQATDEVEVVIEAPNDIPFADAGPDQVVAVGDTVQLNGNGSYDPDGGSLTYSWQFLTRPTGSTSVLLDATTGLPRFTADQAGTFSVQLMVNDGTFDSAPDEVRITAESQDDGDCLSCAAQARMELRRRLTPGDAASGPGLVLLPLLVLFWQRKREE